MNGAGSRNFVPEGWHTITPRIVAEGARELVRFLRQVFGAEGEYREALTRPDDRAAVVPSPVS
jgi:hypothetical protein